MFFYWQSNGRVDGFAMCILSDAYDEMIARLDEIGKDLKEANRKIDSLTDALLKANSKAEKAAIEYKLRDKEYKKLEKKHNALVERLSLMNAQTYASSKSLKGIERKKVLKGKHDDKDDFDGTPTAPTIEFPPADSHHATLRILRSLLFPRKARIVIFFYEDTTTMKVYRNMEAGTETC